MSYRDCDGYDPLDEDLDDEDIRGCAIAAGTSLALVVTLIIVVRIVRRRRR